MFIIGYGGKFSLSTNFHTAAVGQSLTSPVSQPSTSSPPGAAPSTDASIVIFTIDASVTNSLPYLFSQAVRKIFQFKIIHGH